MEALEKAATKGPWAVELDDNEQPNIWNEERWIALLPHQCVTEIEKQANADAAFIAAARAFVSKAVEEIRRWREVFGHLGTPDAAGNAINEKDAALRAKVAALVAFARTTCTCQQLPFEQTMPCETCELLARIDGDEL